MLQRIPRSALFAPLLALVLGCDGGGLQRPPTYPVSGAVTLDGTPVAKGTISFVSASDLQSGLPSGSAEIVNGEYQGETTAGKKRVIIEAPLETGPADETGVAPTKETIPARYNANSELEVEVTPEGANEFDFTLESS